MAIDERLLDVLRFAYLQEVKAAVFYEQLAARTPEPLVSEKLTGLARTEQHHQKCVEQWYRLATGRRLVGTIEGGELEGSAEFDKTPVSLDDVLDIAIRAEKQAEQFYRRWAAKAKTEEERDLLDLMATQERDHVMVLTEERVAAREAELCLAGVVNPLDETDA